MNKLPTSEYCHAKTTPAGCLLWCDCCLRHCCGHQPQVRGRRLQREGLAKRTRYEKELSVQFRRQSEREWGYQPMKARGTNASRVFTFVGGVVGAATEGEGPWNLKPPHESSAAQKAEHAAQLTKKSAGAFWRTRRRMSTGSHHELVSAAHVAKLDSKTRACLTADFDSELDIQQVQMTIAPKGDDDSNAADGHWSPSWEVKKTQPCCALPVAKRTSRTEGIGEGK